MKNIQIEIAEKYQEFFNFMNKEHNLILTKEQMDEIVYESDKLVKNFGCEYEHHTKELKDIGECRCCGLRDGY